MSADPQNAIDAADVEAVLVEHGLISRGEPFQMSALSGGVSCDVFKLDFPDRPSLVLKRALPRLRVTADWHAPVERAESEVEWIRLVAKIDRRLVPDVVARDTPRHLFVMRYLPPEDYPVWKGELAAGTVDASFAAAVGRRLAQIHASTAHSTMLAERSANDEQFFALRLDAYLLHMARAHPDLAEKIGALVDGVRQARIALMHGDVSPKNILRGPEAPVFLDAETACYGDPAFDLAFCLNHLLLKAVWHPEFADRYPAAFLALKDTYLTNVGWESPAAIEGRAVRLLSALLLARIDGKSPVEYLTAENDKAYVRAQARSFLERPPDGLAELQSLWSSALSGYLAGAGSR